MIKKLRCLVVDDEPFAIKILNNLIQNHPYLTMYGSYTNPLLALSNINKEDEIDILFLDIDMPELNGFELASRIRHMAPYLIFTTSHEKYALKGYEVNANQFLIKPITDRAFIDAINRLRTEPTVRQELANIETDDSLYLKLEVKGNIRRISKQDIIYIEPIKGSNYMKVVTKNEELKTLSSIRFITNLLDSDNRFRRVSRSYIINTSAIISVKGNVVSLQQNHQVTIGSAYKEVFLNYIMERLLNEPKQTITKYL